MFFKHIWHKYILVWWYRLWVRKNEFHKSLEIDEVALGNMNKEEEKRYLDDLQRRRDIAHRKNIAIFDRIKERNVYRKEDDI